MYNRNIEGARDLRDHPVILPSSHIFWMKKLTISDIVMIIQPPALSFVLVLG